MADGFEMGRTRGGMLAGLQPLIHRALGIAGSGQVMGQKLGLALDEIGEKLLQHCCDARVQFLASGAQQCAVRGVLHQRVLEEIGGLRRDTAAKQPPGLDQPVEARSQFGGRPPRHLLDQVVVELAAEHRANLPDFLGGRPEPIEARDQRCVQGGRDSEGRRRAGRQNRDDLVFSVGAFEHRFGQLFDEQWHAVGALHDLTHDLSGKARIAGEPLDQFRAVTPAEPI